MSALPVSGPESERGRRYFHGTVATLRPGEVLLPGHAVGLTVHGNATRADRVYATSGVTDDEQQYAIAEAEEWAAQAADVACDGTLCGLARTDEDPEPHYAAWRDGAVLPCIRVYQVVPVDPATVEPDPSTDVRHGGRRMSLALIVTRIH